MPWSPPLDVRSVRVYRALFEAQMEHTLERVRDGLKGWCAVHIDLESSGSTRIVLKKDTMRETLTARLAPWGVPYNPEVAGLTSPAVPASLLMTFMPHQEIPRRVKLHEGWTYVTPADLHRRMTALSAKAGEPRALRGQVILDDWAGRVATPVLERTLRELTASGGTTVTLYDTEHGHEAPVSAFLAQTDRILHYLERLTDLLYFDDQLTWAVHYQATGPMRVLRFQ